MRFLAWLFLAIAGLLSLGFLAMFVDAVATGTLLTGSNRFLWIATLLSMFLSNAYLGYRAIEYLAHPVDYRRNGP